MKILLVEDDETAAMVAQIILESLDCLVTVVGTVVHAIEAFQKESFDLVFIDIGLPDGDGLTLVQMTREKNLCPKVPLIVLTAHNNQEHKDRAKVVGADDYVVKPLTRDTAAKILKAHKSLSRG